MFSSTHACALNTDVVSYVIYFEWALLIDAKFEENTKFFCIFQL